MKCLVCGAEVAEGAAFCTTCGASMAVAHEAAAAYETAAAPAEPVNEQPPQYMPPVYFDPTDHTAEFASKDISDNKVIAMMPYLLGTAGVVIALLAAKESPYAGFHVRQALKITVVQVLVMIVAVVLCWTVVVPVVAGISFIVLLVIRIICFFRVCCGSAKEVPLLNSFGFLK